MIPYYLFSNFHCFGMCGPIAALVGKHPFWRLYLIGRIVGFTLACTLFALFGEVISWKLGRFQGYLSLIAGAMILMWSLISFKGMSRWGNTIQKLFLTLFARKSPWSAWSVGFCTPLLPCGQSMIVFTFCALLGNGTQGIIQGLLFSLLTTPSLFLAIKGMNVLLRYKKWVDPMIKVTTLTVGVLAMLRGLAELDVIAHYTLIPDLHLVLW